MVRLDATGFRCEAKCQSDVEFLESAHLSIKPFHGPGAQAIGPAQTGAQIAHAQCAQPAHRLIEPVILEVKPLADTKLRRVRRKTF